MLNRIIFFLILIFPPFFTQAQADIKPIDAATTTQSLLWEITGNGLEKPSYLFGTIHIIGKDDYFFHPYMEKAFNATEQVTFEIKVDDMMNSGAQLSMMSKMYMDDDVTLKDLISAEDYTMVKTHFEKMGLPFTFFERMKPMFLSAMGGDMNPTAMQTGEMVSYELKLMEKAKQKSLPIGGLETMEFQMSLFDSIPYDAQAKMLVESVKSGNEGSDQLEQMIEIYKAQDIEAMQTLVEEDEGGLMQYEEILLLKRNRNWIPVMKKMMDDKPTFFAVGAGHLAGEEGVIQLLKNAGYTVKPIVEEVVAEAAPMEEEAMPTEAATSTGSLDQSLLWKITGEGLEKPSYLFGTIHIIGKEDYFFYPHMQAAFDATEQVMFEIKVDDMMNFGAQLSMLTKVNMKGGVKLKDLISEKDYALVRKHFEAMGLPFMLFERMKPMFLSAFGGGDMNPQAMQSGEMVSYELKLMDKAKKKGLPIGGLETMEYQMSLFDSIPYEAQAEMLVQSVKAGDSGSDQLTQMVEIYKAQDIQSMQAMVEEDEDGFGKYEEVLLLTRNRNWIPVMAEKMSEKPTFFAVGAGHLAGEEGVIQLLKNKGYMVTPVKE